MASDGISSAFRTGFIEEDDSQGNGWTSVRPRVEAMLHSKKFESRTTLFLGATISSFKPTGFPAWAKFIELTYTALVDQATAQLEGDSQDANPSLKACISRALTWPNQAIPNYKVTEVIARRLGKDYLRLLRAFEAQKNGSDWTVNHAHVWAAKSLIDGSAAAVVTTNFDDCIEKALLNAESNTYTLTGDPHVDSDEIINRLGISSGKLVLVVSGSEASRFAQTLLPQFGERISFLFKLHGSCYMPESCIDTRLQRQQGLPSYAIALLDNLLARSVFFMVGFSGGDLNDNTDYLRMIHNKGHARIVWLLPDLNQMESGVRVLSEKLNTNSDASEGLCIVQGSMSGERIKWDEEPSTFKDTVKQWCQGLGSPWCKLVVLDLIELCGGTMSQILALQKLGFSDGVRQDWNAVIEKELGEVEEQEQLEVARECRSTVELLQHLFTGDLDEDQRKSICHQLEHQRSKIRSLHLEQAKRMGTNHPHAQAWVISALYGLILICGGQQRAAAEALSFAQNAAYLVGDLESCNLTRKCVEQLKLRDHLSSGSELEATDTGLSQPDMSAMAFIPSLDNVQSRANQYGVPPALYLRALLHRAILFADSIIIPPNILTNSSVFINDLIFGVGDDANRFYLSFLHPIIPRGDNHQQGQALLSKYRETLANSYIAEEIAQSHIQQLDTYFESVGIDRRYTFYSFDDIAGNYNMYIRKAVSERKALTKTHLMDRWKDMRSHRLPFSSNINEIRDEERAADMVDTIVKTVELFMQNLKDPVTRSKLYHLAGLFATVLDDNEVIHEVLKDQCKPEVRESIVTGRKSMLERTWISGPLCHELFDVPYRGNLPIHLIMNASSPRNIIFLEESDVSSWKFMAGLLSDPEMLQINDQAVSIGSSAKISALLLSQASENDLQIARRALTSVRRKLAANEHLNDAARTQLASELRIFALNSVDVEDQPIDEIVVLDQDKLGVLHDYLSHSVFLVRRGEAVDRMYEEPQFTLPGALILERT